MWKLLTEVCLHRDLFLISLGKGGRPGFHTDLHGSAGSAVTGPTLSGCSPQYGASVHRGILRSTRHN